MKPLARLRSSRSPVHVRSLDVVLGPCDSWLLRASICKIENADLSNTDVSNESVRRMMVDGWKPTCTERPNVRRNLFKAFVELIWIVGFPVN